VCCFDGMTVVLQEDNGIKCPQPMKDYVRDDGSATWQLEGNGTRKTATKNEEQSKARERVSEQVTRGRAVASWAGMRLRQQRMLGSCRLFNVLWIRPAHLLVFKVDTRKTRARSRIEVKFAAESAATNEKSGKTMMSTGCKNQFDRPVHHHNSWRKINDL
jgi:hypothetical protein